MLIKRAVLDQILAGKIDTLFRKQKRPTVRAGGTLRTPIGMLDILKVEPIEPSKITTRDARRSGATSAAEVRAQLETKAEGTVYRVRVKYAGDDPRIALRENDRLSTEELQEVTARLVRLDRASQRGPWTRTFLELLRARPFVRAPDLAESLGMETKPFKNDVRKLKALGLTISHSPGYELSPRGHAVLARLLDS